MPRWLLWFLGIFVAVNGLAMIGGFPNPFTMIYDFVKNPPADRRTLDAGIQGLGMVMGVAMLIGWAVLALVMWAAMRAKPAPPPG